MAAFILAGAVAGEVLIGGTWGVLAGGAAAWALFRLWLRWETGW